LKSIAIDFNIQKKIEQKKNFLNIQIIIKRLEQGSGYYINGANAENI